MRAGSVSENNSLGNASSQSSDSLSEGESCNAGVSYVSQPRSLMNPDEIRTLDPDAMIFISDTQDPALLQKTPLYKTEFHRFENHPNEAPLAPQNPTIYSRPLILS